MEAILLPYTIWKFFGVSIPDIRIVAKISEPREYENEYCRIIGHVEAYNASQALKFLDGGPTNARQAQRRRKMTIEKIYDDGIMAEIDPDSDTPRLREYFAHLEKCGPAKKWDDLAGLNITEKDFADGPCHLGVDNAGTLVIFILTRIPDDTYNDIFGWCRRPKLGEAHFDYSECPEWLKQKFDHYWGLYSRALKDHYGFFD